MVTISQKAFEVLYNYNWPGNVRELENVLERVILNTENHTIDADNLAFLSMTEYELNLQKDKIMTLEECEKMMIEKAMAKIW
jgi:transcriptional regulator with PAS, ATPase and Fis domain